MFFTGRPNRRFDWDQYDPSPLTSPFINIEKMPPDLDRLPDRVLPFIWFFVRQVKWSLFLFWGLFIISSVLTSMMPFFAREIVSVFETSTREDLWQNLWPVIQTFIIVMVILDSGTYHAARYVWAQIAWPIRALAFRQISWFAQSHALSYFQNDFAGRLANKMSDTADSFRHMLREVSTPFTFGIIQFIMALVLSAQAAPIFTALLAAYFAAYGLILLYFIPRVMRASLRTQDSKTHVNGQSVDVISNIYTTKVFARRDHESERLGQRLNDMARKGRRMAFAFNKMFMCFDVITKIMWVAMFGVLLQRISNGQSSLADAAMLVPIVMAVSQSVWWMTEILIVILEYAGTIKDGLQTLVHPFTIRDKDKAQALAVNKGRIDIKDLTFAYPGRPVFEDLTITVEPGQKIGLVGPSGAGKSTLVQLLLRLHDVQKGSIAIDGQNIADVMQDSLRERIAIIPQSSDLLHRSIRENIAYGRLNATQEEIEDAARRAHAHDFILSLRDHEGRTGYDATVGERGVKLSGGQRQRIAIARAILKDAPILLLDEATSALDSESERLIQDSLAALMKGRTVVVIAHRLSTIARLDRLIVMEDGRIIEDGNHAELLAAKGLYAHLWALQSGGFLGDEHS